MRDVHIGRQSAPSRRVHVEARSRGKQALARARDEQGSSLVEFAVVLPCLMIVLLGIVMFGIAYNNYLVLTNATNQGAQAFAMGSGIVADPCLTTGTAIAGAATNLNPSNLLVTIVINPPPGSTVSGFPETLQSDTSASSLTCSGTTIPATYEAQVKATYPCNLELFGFNPAPNCTLTAQTTEAVQ